MHIYGIQKDGTDEVICSAATEMQTQRTDLLEKGSGGEEGEGGTNGNTHTTICEKDSQWEFAL